MVTKGVVPGESAVQADQVSARIPGRRVVSLTNRETEVLLCLAEGLSNREIAYRLGLTEGTVKSHVFHLYRKLGIKRRVQAIAWAIANHLLD